MVVGTAKNQQLVVFSCFWEGPPFAPLRKQTIRHACIGARAAAAAAADGSMLRNLMGHICLIFFLRQTKLALLLLRLRVLPRLSLRPRRRGRRRPRGGGRSSLSGCCS